MTEYATTIIVSNDDLDWTRIEMQTGDITTGEVILSDAEVSELRRALKSEATVTHILNVSRL